LTLLPHELRKTSDADEGGSLYVHNKTSHEKIAQIILENFDLRYLRNHRNAQTQAITSAEKKLPDKSVPAG